MSRNKTKKSKSSVKMKFFLFLLTLFEGAGYYVYTLRTEAEQKGHEAIAIAQEKIHSVQPTPPKPVVSKSIVTLMHTIYWRIV